MAKRKVFTYTNRKCDNYEIEFYWHPGISSSQRKMSVKELHSEILVVNPNAKILEVSSVSEDALGVALSAFNLITEFGVSVESIYQGSKVFTNGGPYQDLYSQPSGYAKKDERLTRSGQLIGFSLLEIDIPKKSVRSFYNYLYVKALLQNQNLVAQLAEYNTFTDIMFNHEKGKSCQAEAVTFAKALIDHNLVEQAMSNIEVFDKIVYGD